MINKIKHKIYNFLKWTEKWTKTDMVYLAKGGFWLTSAKIVSILASLLSSIAFANLLPKETYGTYRYILSIAGLLSIPTLNGINTSLVRSIAKGYEGSFIPALKTKMCWGTLGGLSSIALSIYYYTQGNNVLSVSLIIAAIFLPLMDPLYLYINLLNGKKLFKHSAKYSFAARIIPTASLIATIFLTSNILVIISIYFASNTLLRLFYLLLTLRRVKINTKLDDDVINFGKHLSLMGILGKISTYIDKILIFHYAGAATLAIYFLALTPFKQTQNFFTSLNMLALPKLSSINITEIKKTLPKKVIKSYLIIIPTIILYIIVAPLLFKLFYPQYLDSVSISRFFMLLLLFYPISMFGTAITAQAEKRKLYISSTSYALIRITMLFILVPTWGISGAITAILAASAINSIITISLFYKM